jgi:hypothetical protein
VNASLGPISRQGKERERERERERVSKPIYTLRKSNSESDGAKEKVP